MNNLSEYITEAIKHRPEVKKEAAAHYSRGNLASQMAEIIL